MPVFHPLSLEGKLVQSEPIIHSSTKALRRQIELKKNGLASSFSETVFFEAWRAHKPYFPSHTSVTSCSTLVNSLSLHYRENRKKLPLLQQCAPNDLIHVMADEAAKGRQGKQTRGKKPKQSSKSGGSTKHKKGESKKPAAGSSVFFSNAHRLGGARAGAAPAAGRFPVTLARCSSGKTAEGGAAAPANGGRSSLPLHAGPPGLAAVA